MSTYTAPYGKIVLLVILASCIVRESRSEFLNIINVPPNAAPSSIGNGTQLNLFDGGRLRYFSAENGSELNLFGGSVQSVLIAQSGSAINVSGGSVPDGLVAISGSKVNVSGGTIRFLYTQNNVELNVSGGAFDLIELYGSSVNISGGSLGELTANTNSIKIAGGEFRLNGMIIDGLESVGSQRTIELPKNYVLSGILADGNPFIIDLWPNYSEYSGDSIRNGTLTLESVALPPIQSPLIVVPTNSAPRGLRGGQTLIVGRDGAVDDNFVAGRESIIDVVGGNVGNNLEADDAAVSISNGSIGEDFTAYNNSRVEISGGSIGNRFAAIHGATVNVARGNIGNHFRAQDGVSVNVSGGTIGGDFIAIEIKFNMSGGVVDDFSSFLGSEVAISGGTIGPFSDLGNSEVNITGGSIGIFSTAFDSRVTMSGGSIGADFRPTSSVFNVVGGSIGANFELRGDNVVDLKGGVIDSYFTLYPNNTINFSGGTIGDRVSAAPGSKINIFGGDFRIDGKPIDADGGFAEKRSVDISLGSVLSGTLADGTPFAFLNHLYNDVYSVDTIADGVITLTETSLPAVGPPIVRVSSNSSLQGIRDGQTLIVEHGGVVGDHFSAGHGSSVVVDGGIVGRNLELVGTNAKILAGSVGGISAYYGTEIEVSGGSIEGIAARSPIVLRMTDGDIGHVGASQGGIIDVTGDSHVGSLSVEEEGAIHVSGGCIDYFDAKESVVNISGGLVHVVSTHGEPSEYDISGGTVTGNMDPRLANISGGSIDARIYVAEESVLNLFVREALLDGRAIPLRVGEEQIIEERGGAQFFAILADGSSFDLALNANEIPGEDWVTNDGILTVTLVPEPSTLALLLMVTLLGGRMSRPMPGWTAGY